MNLLISRNEISGVRGNGWTRGIVVEQVAMTSNRSTARTRDSVHAPQSRYDQFPEPA
ncbi:MAG: hypothetical protein IPH85_14310 [Ignavibacteria bacterium]|nr:hypothetical protein [Ignavibacteria bacterium]